MAGASVAFSETVTLVTTVEQHFTSTQWYEWIVIDNSDNTAGASGAEVYCCFDGGTAVAAAAHCMMVPPGETKTFANQMPLPQANETYSGAYTAGVFKNQDGKMDTNAVAAPVNPFQATAARSQSQSVNWTTQQGFTAASGTPTYASIVSVGTPNVTITFQ
jgi:hypothetical protein